MDNISTRDDFLAKYDMLVAWRTIWLMLAKDVKRARAERRTTLQQERIERRVVRANLRIAALMAEYDVLYKNSLF